MKRRIRKMYLTLALVGMMVMSQMSMVFAASTAHGVAILGSGQASITIQGNEGQTLAGKTWRVHRLFFAENTTGTESIRYSLNDIYKSSLQKVVASKLEPSKSPSEVTEYEMLDYIHSLNEHATEGAQINQTLEGSYSDYRYFIEELIAQLHTDGITGTQVKTMDTTENNSIVLSGLDYGYYLIEDVTDAQDKNMAVSLSIVTTANPDVSVNVKSDYSTVIKKLQEDDNNIGWNDIGDFEIGQKVPYKYESLIPNINGYKSYYYAWHDVMDEALTLQTNSIKITISGELDGASKEYELGVHEFKLITGTGNSDTFQIQINDIKKIVDREFPQFNDLDENVYGQKVTVEYDALLNEKAAKNTGRPGFENDVRLEFSNNPNATGSGMTGYTPWDTVVCFTYRMEGVKVNNKNAALANAKFKLYYDEACTDQVFVKQIDEGYCVVNDDSSTTVVSSQNVPMVSNSKGEFTLFGLDSGTYYLKETEAPAGYRPILEPIKVVVTATFPSERNAYVKGTGSTTSVLNLGATAKITTFENGEEKSTEKALTTNADEGSMMISIVNQIGTKLPMTGSYVMPVLFVAGSMCIVAGLKSSKKKYE